MNAGLEQELRQAQETIRALEEELAETNRGMMALTLELTGKSEEVQAMSQQLWQAAKLATMGELAASIAHELNNPLATVSLRIEGLLQQAGHDGQQRRALEAMEQEVARMGHLVASLLQFSRRSHQQISTLDVREEIAATLELVHYHLRNHRITVVREFAPDVPAMHADRQQLRQMLLNLLTNAGDAMPQGGTLALRVAGEEEEGRRRVVLEITDTGTGISPENLPRVWDPFFTTKPEGKGTGLGLAICRRIVQEHRGTITLQSQPGQGTTVRIILPANSGTNGLYLRQSEEGG